MMMMMIYHLLLVICTDISDVTCCNLEVPWLWTKRL